ncbi:universal stress protein [Lactococcus kimchii]|uniref:universal stress protein n=1 Tax=Lactococcus sp. S-13 TaxID=2507158 RepID=UPI001023A8D9|nr:universal stress protein [Lactococcus sp. S-13]RZI49467.1 universal stress protein [Lactococcus sp. S-13]
MMENYKKILVAIDGSEQAEEAVHEAVAICKLSKAQLFVLHATDKVNLYAAATPMPTVPAPALPIAPNLSAVDESIEQETQDIMNRATALIGPQVNFETVKVEGSPQKEIVDFAKDHEIDLIVMGSSGKGALDRMLLGSTAVYVVKHAPCNVMIIK